MKKILLSKYYSADGITYRLFKIDKEYYVMKTEKESVMLKKPYGKSFIFYKGMLGNLWVLK